MTVIATAGHVDHGKSSLIRAITGVEPDRLAEEQRKGMTIDLGFAHVTTHAGNTLSFIDVPGHTDFIRTMISGVSGVDIALLVIDAGEGWKPQTEEHLGILEVLGVTTGVVALSKCDRVSTEVVSQRTSEVTARLRQSTIHWHDVLHTSAHTGDGLEQLVSVLETLSQRKYRPVRHGAHRLFVDRVFTIKGAGTVVTGTLDSAALRVSDSLIVARTSEPVRLRTIQVHGETVDHCEPGSRCAVNISGVDADHLVRGDALIAPALWKMTDVFDANITTLTGLQRPLTQRGSFTIHIGSHFQTASLRIIGAEQVATASTGLIRVRFAQPLPLVPGDRYLLRDTSTNSTIGGGTILDVHPLLRVSRAQPQGTIESIMDGRGFVPVEEARRLTGQPLEAVVGHWFATPNVVATALDNLSQQLDTYSELRIGELLPHERDLVALLPHAVRDGDVIRRPTATPLSSHPLAVEIRSWGLTGPSSSTVDRNIIRQLIQQGIVFEHDAIAFHSETLIALRPQLESLWALSSHGFTVSQLREHLGITRKHAVPLAECLDKMGLTRRTGDYRLPGHKW